MLRARAGDFPPQPVTRRSAAIEVAPAEPTTSAAPVLRPVVRVVGLGPRSEILTQRASSEAYINASRSVRPQKEAAVLDALAAAPPAEWPGV